MIIGFAGRLATKLWLWSCWLWHGAVRSAAPSQLAKQHNEKVGDKMMWGGGCFRAGIAHF